MEASGSATGALPRAERGWIVYARSTTFHAHTDSIDKGIAHIRDEVMPTLQGMAGCVGLSLLVDRDSGRCIATSAWQSEEAMRASEDRVRMVRDHAAEIFGGRPDVDEWEIAVLHRHRASEPGACVRATWMRFDVENVDRAVDVYKLGMLPEMEDIEGFCSASLLIDRESRIAVSSVTYDSREAMERSRERAAELRSRGAQEARVEVLDVCEFELALAHLRVPENA